MKAFFDNGDIRQVDINGNVLVVYYPIDEKDSTIMFMNYTEGSYLKMFIKERKMDKGIFIGKTTGTTYPLDQVPEGKDRLETFAWFGDLRPRNKDDIFEWRGKAQDQTLRKIERDSDQSPRSIRTNRRNNR